MTRSERERLIERYMSGEMSSADESDFFLQIALDKELRQELQAQRTIESAFRKERDMESTEHTALRGRVATMLAASSAPSPMPRGASPAPPVPGRAAGLRTRLATPTQWVTATIIAVALTIGVIFLTPGGEEKLPPIAPERGAGSNHSSGSGAPTGGSAPSNVRSAPGTLPGITPGREQGTRAPDASTTSGKTGSTPGLSGEAGAATPRQIGTASGETRSSSGALRNQRNGAGRTSSTSEYNTSRSGPSRAERSSMRPASTASRTSVSEPSRVDGNDTSGAVESGSDPLKVGVTIKFPKMKKAE